METSTFHEALLAFFYCCFNLDLYNPLEMPKSFEFIERWVKCMLRQTSVNLKSRITKPYFPPTQIRVPVVFSGRQGKTIQAFLVCLTNSFCPSWSLYLPYFSCSPFLSSSVVIVPNMWGLCSYWVASRKRSSGVH